MAFDELIEELKVLASTTSTMDVRVQEMILQLAHEEPRIRNMEKGHIEIHFKDDVTIRVTDHPDWEVPKELRIRAEGDT